VGKEKNFEQFKLLAADGAGGCCSPPKAGAAHGTKLTRNKVPLFLRSTFMSDFSPPLSSFFLSLSLFLSSRSHTQLADVLMVCGPGN
jgi:hypothetical protein